VTVPDPFLQGDGPAAPQCAAPRCFLFLQGPIGPFFSDLAGRLLRSGHRVRRINFNGGDSVFWKLPGALPYRGTAEAWPDFLTGRLADWEVTDLVLFGDCRPLHRAARTLAQRHGIAVHVFEEGYLRPNWVTMEAGGVNRNSAMPRSAEWFRETAQSIPSWDPGVPVIGHFARRALEDVIYNLSTVLSAWAYPHYRSHKPWHPLVEYAAGARRFPFKPFNKRGTEEQRRQIMAAPEPYYLFPLQLDADSQIRFHSPFGGMAPAIVKVIQSFARSAPAPARLVITEHPLDTGVVDLRRVTRECAAAAGVAGRVVYLGGGSPVELVQGSRGMVTVNSTIGILALNAGVGVAALGYAIYDMPGLTFQGELDAFWTQAPPPDAAAFDCFRRVVAVRTQVNGGFYSKAARSLAVAGAAARFEAAQSAAVTAQTINWSEREDRRGGTLFELMPGITPPGWDAEAISK
jgi:capsular polysaccharide export protein